MAPQPTEPTPSDAEGPSSVNAAAPPDGAAAAQDGATGSDCGQKRPYLGISVQYIESHATPGRDLRGLAVVSVDPKSPADHAGLRGRGPMTGLGASGATAGAMMPPLDIILMPLLRRSGQLGLNGDLIVAIDDKRIENERDLQDQIEGLKPGDTIYFTVVRTDQKGLHRTLKIPIKLGDPQPAIANASAAQNGAASGASAASQPASP
jgi:S1-C subfamily serine protease